VVFVLADGLLVLAALPWTTIVVVAPVGAHALAAVLVFATRAVEAVRGFVAVAADGAEAVTGRAATVVVDVSAFVELAATATSDEECGGQKRGDGCGVSDASMVHEGMVAPTRPKVVPIFYFFSAVEIVAHAY